MFHIYIVEDNPTIARELAEFLRSWGYKVTTATDFSRIFQEYTQLAPDLVLLDIYLPTHNGYHWCQKIRESSQVPIIFISSATEDMNLVMALNMGGDDFITKPFELTVVLAKVQAVLRRAYDFGEPATTLSAGDVTLDLGTMLLKVGGRSGADPQRVWHSLPPNEPAPGHCNTAGNHRTPLG